MQEIIICANTVTGRIEVETSDWAEGDPRWDAITDGSFLLNGTEVEPWGADEENMDRATKAVADNLGFLVSDWRERPDRNGELRYATVLGIGH